MSGLIEVRLMKIALTDELSNLGSYMRFHIDVRLVKIAWWGVGMRWCGSAGLLLQQRLLVWSRSAVEPVRRNGSAIAIRSTICWPGSDRPLAVLALVC
jgi:hypothetical protein